MSLPTDGDGVGLVLQVIEIGFADLFYSSVGGTNGLVWPSQFAHVHLNSGSSGIAL